MQIHPRRAEDECLIAVSRRTHNRFLPSEPARSEYDILPLSPGSRRNFDSGKRFVVADVRSTCGSALGRRQSVNPRPIKLAGWTAASA